MTFHREYIKYKRQLYGSVFVALLNVIVVTLRIIDQTNYGFAFWFSVMAILIMGSIIPIEAKKMRKAKRFIVFDNFLK